MIDHLLYALQQQYSTLRKFLIQYRPTFRKFDIKQKIKFAGQSTATLSSKIVIVIFQTEKNDSVKVLFYI